MIIPRNPSEEVIANDQIRNRLETKGVCFPHSSGSHAPETIGQSNATLSEALADARVKIANLVMSEEMTRKNFAVAKHTIVELQLEVSNEKNSARFYKKQAEEESVKLAVALSDLETAQAEAQRITSDLAVTVSEKVKLGERVKELEEAKEDLRQHKNLEESNNLLQSQLTSTLVEYEKLKATFEETSSMNSTLASDLSDLTDRNNALLREKTGLEEHKSALEQQVKALEARLKDGENGAALEKKTHADLEEGLRGQLGAAIDLQKKTSDRVEDLSKEIIRLAAENDKMGEENSALCLASEEVNAQREILVSENQKLQKGLDEMTAVVKKMGNYQELLHVLNYISAMNETDPAHKRDILVKSHNDLVALLDAKTGHDLQL